MREFIRHPTDVPIIYKFGDIVADKTNFLKNISQGGLCFSSKVYIEEGTTLDVEIPVSHPVFSATGVVVWCRACDDFFDVGVKFMDMATEETLRIVEQVCYIEHYKKEVAEKEGRLITGQEAALEWIKKFAKDFPR